MDKLRSYYRASKYFAQAQPIFESLINSNKKILSEFNEDIICRIAKILGIKFSFVRASQIQRIPIGSAQDTILSICKEVGGNEYYNFKRGIELGLYNIKKFSENGVKIFRQDYQHPIYAQKGNKFMPKLSIADLLYSEDISAAIEVIRSGRKWIETKDSI